MQASTEEYLNDQDSLGQWVAERTRIDPRATTRSRDLFADWSAWCRALNLSPGTEKGFVEDLKKLGWSKVHRGKGNVFKGVALVDPEQNDLQLHRNDEEVDQQNHGEDGEDSAPKRPPFKVVGTCSPDLICVQCGGGGDVKKIAPNRPGEKAEPLHEECARFWFCSKH